MGKSMFPRNEMKRDPCPFVYNKNNQTKTKVMHSGTVLCCIIGVRFVCLDFVRCGGKCLNQLFLLLLLSSIIIDQLYAYFGTLIKLFLD